MGKRSKCFRQWQSAGYKRPTGRVPDGSPQMESRRRNHAEPADAGHFGANTRPRTFLCLHVRSHRTCQPHRYGNMDGLYADDSRGGHIAHGKLVSLEKMPMLIGSSTSLPQALRKTDDEQLSFSYTGSVYPTQKEALRLIPFFRLHDSRYAIYFHQVSEAEVESIRQEMERKERKAMELANQTADIIFPGEQQPESDHGIRYEQAETGTDRDRHFRRAKGWFGYTLKTSKEASRLMITTRKNDPMKVAILLNNERLTAAPTISEADQEGFVTLCYPLPQKLGAGNYPIRFSPDGTEWTPAIYEIRLLE